MIRSWHVQLAVEVSHGANEHVIAGSVVLGWAHYDPLGALRSRNVSPGRRATRRILAVQGDLRSPEPQKKFPSKFLRFLTIIR